MPELPEIETIKVGIKCLHSNTIEDIIVRNDKLRYVVNSNIKHYAKAQKIIDITRRAKYLILHLTKGQLIIHLGMSGSLTLLDISEETARPNKHDHVDIIFTDKILRYNDPRRFGCIIFTEDYTQHPLLTRLGVEPLSPSFTAEYLAKKLQNKKSSIKQLIMDNSIVVGVGNIYASESLFLAKISPLRAGNNIKSNELITLVKNIKQVLEKAIELGGSSLRNYKKADGHLGYFQNSHLVYGKAGMPCSVCNNTIQDKRLGQRNSYFCAKCQK